MKTGEPVRVNATEFLRRTSVQNENDLIPKEYRKWRNMDYGKEKDAPGYSSEKGALIAWAKAGKPADCVMVPFTYSDGSYGCQYSNPSERWLVYAPVVEPVAVVP